MPQIKFFIEKQLITFWCTYYPFSFCKIKKKNYFRQSIGKNHYYYFHLPNNSFHWEPDFSQACSFGTILMTHNSFRFKQIPDKTNDVIFVKSSKTLFLGYFWPFLLSFPQWGFFPKTLALSKPTIYGPLTPC